MVRTFGRLAFSPGGATLAGSITDKATGERIPAKVGVTSSDGNFVHPRDSILKVGTGDPFFYSEGTFEVKVSRGLTRVVVERGTEYVPAVVDVEMPARETVAIDVELERWSELGDQGWHPGNTHIHYDEKEERPDERLWLDPRVEDLRMTAISVLRRWDLDYASNKYPPGMLTEFSSAHHYVQCGEENRHGARWLEEQGDNMGYGHIMLLSIRNVVEPVSRGMLVDAFDPDYPPLSYACDDTRRQGGIVIWCHNGRGMEAPVAAALGKVDAFNLFDPYWADAEYDIYYQMLNAGIRLPASTGSDWFLCSGNRVYAHSDGPFDYESWVEALTAGRTFITNGPALTLSVDNQAPGAEVEASSERRLSTLVNWKSHYPISRVEVVSNGAVVAAESYPQGSTEGRLEADVVAESDGWVAARVSSEARDSYLQPIFAHTSPVYVRAGGDGPHKQDAARRFIAEIDASLELVNKKGKFYKDAQRREVVDLFRQGQEVYRAMLP
jgi:hypothetical protein